MTKSLKTSTIFTTFARIRSLFSSQSSIQNVLSWFLEFTSSLILGVILISCRGCFLSWHSNASVCTHAGTIHSILRTWKIILTMKYCTSVSIASLACRCSVIRLPLCAWWYLWLSINNASSSHRDSFHLLASRLSKLIWGGSKPLVSCHSLFHGRF